MKRIISIICICFIIFSFNGCKRNYTHSVYEITIDATVVSNDSVGNDWRYVYTCDGQQVKSGHQMTVPYGTAETVEIYVTAIESDTWDDKGFGSLYVDLEDGFQKYTIVTVRENKGRYVGNTANIRITCNVKLVKNIVKKP